MLKKILILILILIPIVNASLEGDWLLSQAIDQKWPTIEENALSILALKKEVTTYSDTQLRTATLYLKSSLETCMASNSCNVKDAALALIAIKQTNIGQEFEQQLTAWLLNAKTTQFEEPLLKEPLLTQQSDELIVQVLTPGSLDCYVSDPQNPDNLQRVENEFFIVPSSIATPSLKGLNLSCPSLSASSLTLSILRKQQNPVIYFILDEKSNVKEIIAGNTCWGSSYRGTCDSTSTAYALWALKSSNIDTAWLEAQSLTSLEKAILYDITSKKPQYLASLSTAQHSEGHWDNRNIFNTALISSFLPDSQQKTKASSWIQSQKDPNNYCWPEIACNVRATAAVLYSQTANLTSGNRDTDGDGMPDVWELEHDLDPNDSGDASEDPDNDDSTNLQEYINGTNPLVSNRRDDNVTRPENRTIVDERPRVGDACTTDKSSPGKYDALGQCIDNPNDGLPCNKDGTCSTYEDCKCEDCSRETKCLSTGGTTNRSTSSGNISETGLEDNEEESSLTLILLIILVILLLAGVSFLAYKKGLIKLKKKPSKKEDIFRFPLKELPKTPEIQSYPISGRKPAKHGVMEKALEESMREMESLLKKK